MWWWSKLQGEIHLFMEESFLLGIRSSTQFSMDSPRQSSWRGENICGHEFMFLGVGEIRLAEATIIFFFLEA